MLKSFIRSLTSFINDNRQEIRTSLILSSIMTFGFMLIMEFNQELSTTLSLITHALSKLSSEAMAQIAAFILSVCNFIELGRLQLLDSVFKIWQYFASLINAIFILLKVLIFYAGEFKEAIEYLISLSAKEMANIFIHTIGYTGTVIYIFVITSYLTFKTRRTFIDIVNFYSGKVSDFNALPILSRILILHSTPFWIAKESIKFIKVFNSEHDEQTKNDLLEKGVNEVKIIIKSYEGRVNTEKTSD
ncbi:TPA: hypothetical protein ACKP8D_000031 [Pseudomonas putida]